MAHGRMECEGGRTGDGKGERREGRRGLLGRSAREVVRKRQRRGKGKERKERAVGQECTGSERKEREGRKERDVGQKWEWGRKRDERREMKKSKEKGR